MNSNSPHFVLGNNNAQETGTHIWSSCGWYWRKESLSLTFVALARSRKLTDLAFSTMFIFDKTKQITKCQNHIVTSTCTYIIHVATTSARRCVSCVYKMPCPDLGPHLFFFLGLFPACRQSSPCSFRSISSYRTRPKEDPQTQTVQPPLSFLSVSFSAHSLLFEVWMYRRPLRRSNLSPFSINWLWLKSMDILDLSTLESRYLFINLSCFIWCNFVIVWQWSHYFA